MVMIHSEKELQENLLLHNAKHGIRALKKYCNFHPTCDECVFRKDKIGCIFRGKTPREWDFIKDKYNKYHE